MTPLEPYDDHFVDAAFFGEVLVKRACLPGDRQKGENKMLIRTGKRCEEKWEGEKERVNTGIEALGADLEGQTNGVFKES